MATAVEARRVMTDNALSERGPAFSGSFMTRTIEETLADFRASIDNLDAALIYLISERFRLTQKVGEFKRDRNLPPADPRREGEQIARLRELAARSHLDPDFAERLLRFIIDEVIRNHERIRKN
jgi:chorismate mutase